MGRSNKTQQGPTRLNRAQFVSSLCKCRVRVIIMAMLCSRNGTSFVGGELWQGDRLWACRAQQGSTRLNKAQQGSTRPNKTQQGTTRLDKAQQGSTRPNKA